MGSRIDLVKGDNWQGLYVNCKLVLQDHSIELWRAIELLDDCVVRPGKVWCCCIEWLDKLGSLPDLLADVVLDNQQTIAQYWEQ